MKNKLGHLLRTILITGIAFSFNYGINLWLTPFITRNVGTEAYGFVSLAKQAAQYATIIIEALNSYSVRYIALEYHKENKRNSNIFFNSVFFGDLALASAVVFMVLACSAFLEKIINIPQYLITDVKYLFLFVFINFWITTVFTVFSSAGVISDKLDIVSSVKGVSYLTEALILYVLYVVFPARIFFVGVGLTCASIVIAVANIWLSKRYTPDLKIEKKCFSILAVKRLILDGMWTSLNSFGNMLNNGLDLVVCNLLLTSLSMGQLAIAKMMDSIFHGLYQMVAQAFQPIFLKSYAGNNKGNLLKELKLSMKLSSLFSNLAFAGFVALGLVYYKLWIPNEDIELIYTLTIITVLTSISGGPMTPLYYIYTLTLKKIFPCVVTIIGGILNVVGMYLLIMYTDMGIYAVVWTTAIIMSIINFITNPLYMAHSLKLPWYIFYPNIARNIVSCIFLTVLFRGFTILYMPDSWPTLIICIITYSFWGTAVHLGIVLEKDDWKLVRKAWLKKG